MVCKIHDATSVSYITATVSGSGNLKRLNMLTFLIILFSRFKHGFPAGKAAEIIMYGSAKYPCSVKCDS